MNIELPPPQKPEPVVLNHDSVSEGGAPYGPFPEPGVTDDKTLRWFMDAADGDPELYQLLMHEESLLTYYKAFPEHENNDREKKIQPIPENVYATNMLRLGEAIRARRGELAKAVAADHLPAARAALAEGRKRSFHSKRATADN